jgi:uncharacterized membrane protein YfcA
MDWWQVPVVFVTGFVAGSVNAIAGGGSVISFPILVYLGIGPIVANATSNVALWPGVVSASFGYRAEFRGGSKRYLWLAVPSLIGGVAGAAILLHTSQSVFESAAPYLVLFATVLLAAQDALARLRRREPDVGESARWWVVALITQLIISVYGGYFGAGIGILMLATLGLLGFTNIHQMNGLKTTGAAVINGAALVYFVAAGVVLWWVVVAMGIGSIAGGFISSKVAYRVGRETVKRVVVVIGIVMTAALLIRLYL